MYHSVTFGEKNTWDDWCIVPVSRPLFVPPKQKTVILDIPGASSSMDLSEALTGYPLFEDREGSMEFIVMNDFRPWQEAYSDIMGYLHGRRMRVRLEDDPGWYYEGRFAVNAWKSQKDYSRIVIDYRVGPYKWSEETSCGDWLWDPFSFRTGAISAVWFKDIPVDSISSWIEKTFPPGLTGEAPVSPEIVIQGSGAAGVDIRFVNPTVRIDATRHLTDGRHLIPDFLFVGGEEKIYLKGAGMVSIDFHRGRL